MAPVPFEIPQGADSRLRVPARRPPGDGGGNGNGGTPPPPPVNMPDIVYLLRIPQFFPNGLDAALQNQIKDALLKSANENGYPNAEVNFNFDSVQKTTEIGSWLLGPPTGFDDAKQRGLRITVFNIDFPAENNFAISVNNGTIEREVDKIWTSGEIPRHYDSDGKPCSGDDCAIDLNSLFPYFTDLDQPFNPRQNRMYTISAGKYTPAFPDVNFTATTTDIFSIENGQIAITSSTSVENDTSVFNILTAVFFFVGAIYTFAFGIGSAVLPFVATLFFGTEDVIVHIVGDARSAGIGPYVVRSFFPGQLSFPGLPIIPLVYKNVHAGGSALVQATGVIF